MEPSPIGRGSNVLPDGRSAATASLALPNALETTERKMRNSSGAEGAFPEWPHRGGLADIGCLLIDDRRKLC